MALAITPFRAMCGFRPLPAIATALRTTPELAALIPESIIQLFLSLSNTANPSGPAEKAALRDLFSAVMTADESNYKQQLEGLLKRYKTTGAKLVEGVEQELVELVLRLDSQFPGDIGIFCAFLLNYVSLNPGEAIFLGAGEPHAYVSGGECLFGHSLKTMKLIGIFRMHGMHGKLRQCHPRRAHSQITRYSEPRFRADLQRVATI